MTRPVFPAELDRWMREMEDRMKRQELAHLRGLSATELHYNTSITSGAFATLNTTETSDESALGDIVVTGGLGDWVVAKPGLYLMQHGLTVSGLAANTNVIAHMQKNGVTLREINTNVTGIIAIGGTSAVNRLAVNDVIRFRGFHSDSAGSRNIGGDAVLLRIGE